MSDDAKPRAVKRRDFLKIVGVSGAAATTVGCSSEDVGRLIPYLVSPDQTVPGVSNYYATTCRECSVACGVIAETRDGHVTKLEGNPAHPVNRGALCARGQAAVQGLYNPDRFRWPMAKRGSQWSRITWDEALSLLTQRLAQVRGGGQAGNSVFLNQHESGSFPAFLDAWLAALGMGPHLSVDFEADHASIEANRRAYGVAWPRLDFSAARLIVSFGADFLDGWGASIPQQLDFADARAKLSGAPRFVYVGPRRSLTGLNADRWLACRAGSELAIVNFLRGQGNAQDAATASGAPAQAIEELARELTSTRPSMILAGARGANALDVALAASALNQSLGNVGTTIRPAEGYTAHDGVARFDTLLAVTERMRSGAVPLAFVRGANPAYHMPPQARFAEAFARVPFKVSFSLYPDETSELCDLILPDLHSLEQWGDAEPVRGTLSLQQPAMDPVFAETRATADVLIQIARRDPALAARYPFADYRAWLTGRFPGGAAALTTALTRGVAAGSAAARPPPPTAPPPRAAPTLTPQGEFSFITYPSPVLGDGRGANKPWLQELPDPVSKVCWSSWVEIHPETAVRLGVERGDILEVRTAAGAVRAPAYLYLGIRPDTVAMALGQGHRSPSKQSWFDWEETDTQWGYGRYARNIGANALDALSTATDAAGGLVLSAGSATIRRTGDHATLPSTEGSARQHGRGIAQAVLVTDLGTLRPATGAEHADELAPGGQGRTESGTGASRGGPGAPAGTGAATQGPAAEGQHGGGHDIPGSADHRFSQGLRSPVAADAQGELGAPTADDRGTLKGMYDPNHPSGMAKRRWAMTVDLARCTGCSACVTACYAENNIPTVGAPWQNASVFAVERPGFNITRGREMNWIRIERYFEGNEEAHAGVDFETRFLPMLCQHCGNAPCEPVCPVYATYHAPDGLNVQVYNRCVGTRYCSNNCPYKVRYFNWFGYGEPDRKQYAFPEPLNWQLNPDVTVRGKGVMEKCTFCVQRIREAENRAALEHRELAADEFTTACAAACPSRAIVFGDAAAPDWSVTRLIGDARAYHVFEELNTYTAVVYLKKVNHPQAAAQ
jgi:anaerobic selenocysteine-containing dehydrogenase/Fe-S-cluster-containing dehydrogenase component